MPPSTFARNGDPEQGGFGAALAKLFGFLGKTASDYRDYKQYGPDWRQANRQKEIAQQEAEIGLQQKQYTLDQEPVKAQEAKVAAALHRMGLVEALTKFGAQGLQGQDQNQTDAAPLPKAGPFDLSIPPGSGPLAEGFTPREPTMPELDPAAVAASGSSKEAIASAARGEYGMNKMQMAIYQAERKRELTGQNNQSKEALQSQRIKARQADLDKLIASREGINRTNEGGRNTRARNALEQSDQHFTDNQARLVDEFGDAEARRLQGLYARSTRADLQALAQIKERELSAAADPDAKARAVLELNVIGDEIKKKSGAAAPGVSLNPPSDPTPEQVKAYPIGKIFPMGGKRYRKTGTNAVELVP